MSRKVVISSVGTRIDLYTRERVAVRDNRGPISNGGLCTYDGRKARDDVAGYWYPSIDRPKALRCGWYVRYLSRFAG
jgi:hypothetical protein